MNDFEQETQIEYEIESKIEQRKKRSARTRDEQTRNYETLEIGVKYKAKSRRNHKLKNVDRKRNMMKINQKNQLNKLILEIELKYLTKMIRKVTESQF